MIKIIKLCVLILSLHNTYAITFDAYYQKPRRYWGFNESPSLLKGRTYYDYIDNIMTKASSTRNQYSSTSGRNPQNIIGLQQRVSGFFRNSFSILQNLLSPRSQVIPQQNKYSGYQNLIVFDNLGKLKSRKFNLNPKGKVKKFTNILLVPKKAKQTMDKLR